MGPDVATERSGQINVGQSSGSGNCQTGQFAQSDLDIHAARLGHKAVTDSRLKGLPLLPLFSSARDSAIHNPEKIAIVDQSKSESFTYSQLLADVWILKTKIEGTGKIGFNGSDEEPRIAFLVPAGYDYVVAQWAIWAVGGICVPLCTTHPVKELLYTISDSDPSIILLHPEFHSIENELRHALTQKSFMQLTPHHSEVVVPKLPDFSPAFSTSRRALMIYTSGTTSRPKGCVTTHHNITFQARSLVEAWTYSPKDHLIHVLPLHHIHGIINGLTAMLLAGGTVEMYPKFSPGQVWSRWSSLDPSTMFMAVPTVYSRLIEFFNTTLRGTTAENAARDGARRLRLLISGSAALPTPIKSQFEEITDQVLLERYGMTEIGMALSCGLEVSKRLDGSVGWPLPGVQVRLVSTEGGDIIEAADQAGSIEVKGDNVFLEYWRMPDLTAKEFSKDGWFKTGDVAKRDDSGAYFIQGRASVDIIKSGGYKISALEVEREILALENIAETVVVGVDDSEWGQRVAAIIVQKPGTPSYDLKDFRAQLKTEMAPYKVPTILKIVDTIERNAMGKVNKKEIVRKYFT